MEDKTHNKIKAEYAQHNVLNEPYTQSIRILYWIHFFKTPTQHMNLFKYFVNLNQCFFKAEARIGALQDLIDSSTLSSDTKMVLANALYFKGNTYVPIPMYRPNVFPESFQTYPPNLILDQNSCIDNNILELVQKMFG